MELLINRKIFNKKPLEKFYNNDIPTQILFGSAGSSKSYPIFNFVVLWMMEGRSILVTRKVARTLRKSVFSEVCKAIHRLGLNTYFDINKTELTIVCNVSDGSCMMTGLDDPEKLKSITSPKATAIDTIIHEECTEILEDDFDLANSRMRGTSNFSKKVILLFNPISKHHWVYKRFFEPIGWDDEVDNEYKDAHLHIVRFHYSDNKFLDRSEIDRIEALKIVAPKFFRVYGEGKFGITEASVFTNYEIRPILNTEIERLECRTGLDWGYSHKSALSISYYDPKIRTIYITDEIGVRNKTRTEFINTTKAKMTELGIFRQPIYCDTAEPASIQEARQLGLNAQDAKKGPDSVKRGYDFLQSCKIVVDSRCRQTIEELETLYYEKDTFGNYKEEPVKEHDDLIAALRYAYSPIFMITGNVFGFKSKLY